MGRPCRTPEGYHSMSDLAQQTGKSYNTLKDGHGRGTLKTIKKTNGGSVASTIGAVKEYLSGHGDKTKLPTPKGFVSGAEALRTMGMKPGSRTYERLFNDPTIETWRANTGGNRLVFVRKSTIPMIADRRPKEVDAGPVVETERPKGPREREEYLRSEIVTGPPAVGRYEYMGLQEVIEARYKSKLYLAIGVAVVSWAMTVGVVVGYALGQ